MKFYKRFSLVRYALALLLISMPGIPATAGDPVVAVVVNKSNQTESITLIELGKIYRGEKKKWEDGQIILVINRDYKSAERALFYKKVLNKNPTTIFYEKGTGSTVPIKQIVQASPLAAKKFVSRIPNAITYIPLKDVGKRVKILKIDGKLPTDAGYSIK